MFLLCDVVFAVQLDEYLIYLSDNRCFCCMMRFLAVEQEKWKKYEKIYVEGFI